MNTHASMTRWTASQWSLYRRLRIWEDRTHSEAIAIVDERCDRIVDERSDRRAA